MDDGAQARQRRWLRALPKAELHLHLDGSLRPGTALQLAREGRIDLAPDIDEAGMRDLLVSPPRSRDQAELLRAYDRPIALLQDRASLERVTRELVEDVASDETHYAEIRWAPSLHTAGGLSLADGIEAVVDGAHAGRAKTGIDVRLIVVALRTHPTAMATEVARLAAAAERADIAGFDLAGREREVPDADRFIDAFDVAREAGLGISCHAGEWGGAEQVRRSLSVRPARIAHGAPAADDAELQAELIRLGVTLDICPTSNRQAGLADLGPDAPLPRLVRAGVSVTLSTDGRTASDISLVDEMERALEVLGLTIAELIELVRTAHAVAFLQADEALRDRLTRRFEDWVASHPDPASL